MPKQQYYVSTEDFVEPLGKFPIKKGSIFLYLKNFDSDFYDVLYYDNEEDSIYPFFAPKKSLKKIKTSDIDKEKRVLFEKKKANIAKGIVTEEDEKEALLSPEERKILVLNKLKAAGIDIHNITGINKDNK